MVTKAVKGRYSMYSGTELSDSLENRFSFLSSVLQKRKALGASLLCLNSFVSSLTLCVPATMPTHCRSAYCFPSLLPVLLWSDPLHFQPFKSLSSVLFWICSFFLLCLFFSHPDIFSSVFRLLSFILHACWFSHLFPSAQFSFPFSLCISSDPQAICLIASPFSSSTGSFHLLMQFVSKQQTSIRYLLPNCCLSESDCLEKKKRYWDYSLYFKIDSSHVWFPFVSSSFQGTFNSV